MGGWRYLSDLFVCFFNTVLSHCKSERNKNPQILRCGWILF